MTRQTLQTVHYCNIEVPNFQLLLTFRMRIKGRKCGGKRLFVQEKSQGKHMLKISELMAC